MSDTLPDPPDEVGAADVRGAGAAERLRRPGATRVDDGMLRPTQPDLAADRMLDTGTVDGPADEPGAGAEGPPRETVPDDEPAQPEPRPSPSWTGKVLAISVVVVAGAGVLISIALYWYVFRYQHRAHLHVPSNATLAARVELAELAAFPPVRKRLLDAREKQTKDGKNLAERLQGATGVSPTDFREIVLATVDGKSWVAIVGGRLSKGRFVEGLAEVLRAEGVEGWEVKEGLLVGPRGAIGQADDGSIVAGTDAAIVTAALPAAAEESPRLRLPATRAVVFVATQELWTGVAWNTSLPNSMALRKIARADGDLSLGDKPAFDVRITVQKGESPQEVAKDLEDMLGTLKLLLLFRDEAGLRDLVSGAVVVVEGQVVRVRAPWSVSGIERGMEKLPLPQ